MTKPELPDLPGGRRAHRFQVLALSGGGYRGLYSAKVLSELETARGQEIWKSFDLFAGTSIGGIIAIGLAMEQSGTRILDTIRAKGPIIFSATEGWRGRLGRSARNVRALFTPKYRTDGLQAAIEAIVGDGARVADLKRPLLVPAVALTAGASQLFRSVHHPDHRGFAEIPLVDVALATAAAPVYFPAARIENTEYIDGGIIANAPDLVALVEAEQYLSSRRDHIHLMSIGTTSAEAAFASRDQLNRGLTGWLRENRLLEITMAAQQEHALQLCATILGERFFRIDASQSADQAGVLALDAATPTATRTLEAMAEASAAEALQDRRMPQFLAHEGAPLQRIEP